MAKKKKAERLAELEAELKRTREELEQSRREHYRGASGGQFGFGPRHYTFERNSVRWLD